MKLKISIKEVKEEWKPVCTGMRCIIHITENCLWSIVNRDDVETAYKDSGYVINTIRYKDDTHCEGLFRTETIRDATPDEVIAWHILAVDKACWNHDCEICNIGKVYSCLYCVCDSNEANNARELLKDKEVILELVD